MIRKERERPVALKVLEALERRQPLDEKEREWKKRLSKGWEGEKLFDRMTATFPEHTIFLHDLLLHHRQSVFQIDTLVLTSDVIYLYEVKYYEGNYLYSNDEFQLSSGKTILNPLHQVARAKTLLVQLLEEHGYSLPVQAHVIFPHPHFFLYQAPQRKEFLFLPQWKNHMATLSQKNTPLPERIHSLANLLCSLHRPEPQTSELPPLYYDQLSGTLACPRCSTIVDPEFRTFFCGACDHRFSTDEIILHVTEEFRLLFPKEKITTLAIHGWCKGAISKTRIRRTLSKYLQLAGKGKGRHYI